METISITNKGVLKKALEVLRRGGVVMHPTETCYGFAVDVFNEKALKRLYRLKGRDFDKPVSVLVDGVKMVEKYGVLSDKAMELAQKYWPGPLALVVPRRRSLPEYLNRGENFVSFRVSSDEFCENLAEGFGGPLTTTSANVSGKEPLYEVDLSQFGEMGDEIDLVIDGGKINKNKPSTVVKVEGDEMEILRQGGLLCE